MNENEDKFETNDDEIDKLDLILANTFVGLLMAGLLIAAIVIIKMT